MVILHLFSWTNKMSLLLYVLIWIKLHCKGYQRSSLSSNIRVRQLEKSLKEVIEEEFGVKLTPEQKTKHFLCCKEYHI
jgi:hypothetical protein